MKTILCISKIKTMFYLKYEMYYVNFVIKIFFRKYPEKYSNIIFKFKFKINDLRILCRKEKIRFIQYVNVSPAILASSG